VLVTPYVCGVRSPKDPEVGETLRAGLAVRLTSTRGCSAEVLSTSLRPLRIAQRVVSLSAAFLDAGGAGNLRYESMLRSNRVTMVRGGDTMSVPVRVPDDIHEEVNAAARFLGCTPGELLQRSWEAYRSTSKFKEDFELAQKALAVGDFDALVDHYRSARHARAVTNAARARGGRPS
jgi:hypothetical protein